MPLIAPIQASFAGGEYSPSIYPRVDIDKYKSGLRTCRNFIIHPQGGASNRCGMKYINDAKYADSMCVAQEFVFNQSQAYILEIGHYYIRFYTDGSRIENEGVPYEISTPYSVDDISQLKFESSADVIFITHPAFQQRTLTRYGNADWVLATLDYDNGPFMPENIDESTSLSVSAVTGASVTLSVSSVAVTGLSLLLHCNGTNGSTTFTDEAGHIVTANGNAQISTAQSKFGGASGLLDGTGDYLTVASSTDFDMGSGDFTYEMWVRLNSNGTDQRLIDREVSGGNNQIYLERNSDNKLYFLMQSTVATTAAYNTSSTVDLTGSFHHVALVRNGTNVYIFVDGVSQALTTVTAISTTAMTAGATDLFIGASEAGLRAIDGYIDEVRILKGVAAHTSGFTPETSEYSATTVAGDYAFSPLHVGALFKLRHYIESQTVSTSFTSATTSTSIKCFTTWRIITHGTWTGKLRIEKSTNGGTTWTVLRTFSSTADFNANTSGTEDVETNPEPFLIRANMYSYTSGTCNVDLTTDPFYQEGIIRVTTFTSISSVVGEVLQEVGSTTATSSWSEGSWSDYRGWPSVSRFYQDRLVYARTDSEPQTIWMTETGNYYSFLRHSTLLDTDGITVNLPSRQLNEINGLLAFKKLLAFTSASVWSIGPISGNALTPTSVQQDVEEYTGSDDIGQVVIGTEAIYVQSDSEVVKNIGYQLQNDGFNGSDINILAKHLFEGYSIVKMAYQRKPNSIVWCLRSDGVLLGVTYMKEQEVVAWHRHDTDGDIESIAVIPGDTTDEIWMVVNRDNGRFIEKMDGRRQHDISTHVFLDSYVTVDNSTSTVSGLSNLANKVVYLVGDDVVLDTKTVSVGGTFAMAADYTELHIGLQYNSDLETLNIEVPTRTGTSQGIRTKIGNVTLRLINTRGGNIGPNEDTLYEALTYAALNTANGQGLGTTSNFTGDIRVPLGAGWEDGGRVFYRQSDPLPVTIGSITPEVAGGNRIGG